MTGKGSRVALILASITALAFQHAVPFGRLVLYPFTLLATWVHEMGHGMGALVSGGHFYRLEIFRDASGLAWTTAAPGWHSAWVCVAGLISPPFTGAAILAYSRDPKRGGRVLLLLSALLLFSLVFWVRSTVGVVSMAPLAALLAGFAFWGGGARTTLAQLVGVLLAMDTIARIDYLFMSAATIGGVKRASDIAGVAEGMGGPQLMWGVLIAAADVALLVLGLRAAWAPAKA